MMEKMVKNSHYRKPSGVVRDIMLGDEGSGFTTIEQLLSSFPHKKSCHSDAIQVTNRKVKAEHRVESGSGWAGGVFIDIVEEDHIFFECGECKVSLHCEV